MTATKKKAGLNAGQRAIRDFGKVARLNIRCRANALNAWRAAAAKRKLDLTSWIVEQLDAGAANEVAKQEVGISLDGKSEPELVKLAKAVKASIDKPAPTPEFTLPDLDAKCKHAKRHGEVCYKCDPKMGYPTIL